MKIKRSSIIILISLLMQSYAYSQPPGNIQNWQMKWMDGFSSLNTNIWDIKDEFDHYGDKSLSLAENVSITSNDELKIDMKEAYYRSNDPNKINEWWATKQWVQDSINGDTSFHYDYTGGWVESKCAYPLDYGYVEARISFPYASGFHNTFWTLRTDQCQPNGSNAGEVDIAEMLGQLSATTITTNVHLNYDTLPDGTPIDPSRYRADILPNGYSYANNFLVYGLEYTQTTLNFYVNGSLVRTMANPGVIDPVQLIFSSGIHKDYNPPSSAMPASILIDWIKVWEVKEYANQMIKPYLLNSKYDHATSTSSITVMWQLDKTTNSSSTCTFEYGLSTTYGNSITLNEINTTHQYKYDMGGVSSNTKYFYRVTNNSTNQTYTGSFLSAPIKSNSSTFSFYGLGDTQGQTSGSFNNYESQEIISGRILDKIAADPNSQTLIVHAGDWVGTDGHWEEHFFNPTNNANITELHSKVAYTGTKGNHEDAGLNYKKYLPFYYPNANDFYHSQDYGNVHFCFINQPWHQSDNLSSDQISWINNDLQSSTASWNILVFHAGINHCGEFDFITDYNSMAFNKLNTIINNPLNRVKLVINGHNHLYSNWLTDGVVFMTIGGGSYIWNASSSIFENGSNTDAVFAKKEHHYVKYEAKESYIKVVVYGYPGSNYNAEYIIDQFIIPKSYTISNGDDIVWDDITDANGNSIPYYADQIEIKDGGKLTIKSKVLFQNDGNIIVRKGGKLVIDGGDLNNYEYPDNSTHLWRGVLVQGDKNLDQSNESNQGVLEMISGATIENAEVAVYVGEHYVNGAVLNNHGGGIIKIEGAHFLNNQKDIVMRPYELWSTTTQRPIAQVSYIRQTSFKNDANMLQGVVLGKGKMGGIYAYGIKGLKIQGNVFENLDNTLDVFDRGIGIISISSSLDVSPYCDPNVTPCTNTKNQFNKLYYGVVATNGINSNDLVKITDNEFGNTYRAIMLSGTNNAEVLSNDIQAANIVAVQSGQPDPGTPYGIYLNGGKGFKVEENTIYRPSSNGTAAFNGARGIIVHKTGAVNNEIYKNTLTNLFLGDQAQCYNSGTDIPPGQGGTNTEAETGLKFFCNTSQTDASSYDMWMGGIGYCNTPISIIGFMPRFGIAKFQKQPNPDYPLSSNIEYMPAGNRFSDSHLSLPVTATVDFDNGQAGHLKYYWDDLDGNGPDGWKPVRMDNIYNELLGVSFDVCPSKISTGGNGTSLTQLYANLNTAQMGLNSSIILLNIWQDGGNANLDEEVETTQPWDVYQQFNSLLAESPYLSDEVLIEVILNPSFTSLMVKLLMIANPHAVNSDAVMYELENRLPAMPQSYIDEIKSQPETTSQLQVLEGNVATDNHLVSTISEDIKRMYRNDFTNTWAKDSLIAFMSRKPGLYDKYELATIYLGYGLYSDMQNVLTYIDNNFELQEEVQSDYNSIVSLMTIAQNMQENNLYEEGLSEAQRTSLETILTDDRPLIAPIALSILKRDNPEYVYNEAVYNVPQSSPRLAAPKYNSTTDIVNPDFKLYPNPANDYTTLSYNCKYTNMTYSISDIQGRTLNTVKLQSIEDVNSNEVLIDLSNLSPGNYQVIIKTNNLTLWNGKLIVTE